MAYVSLLDVDRSNGAWLPPLSFYRLEKGFFLRFLIVRCRYNVQILLRVVSMNRSLMSGGKGEKEKKEQISLSHYRGFENYFWNLDCSFSEEGRRRSKQRRNLTTYASGRTHARTKWRTRCGDPPLSRTIALRSPSPSFLPCRKTDIFYT